MGESTLPSSAEAPQQLTPSFNLLKPSMRAINRNLGTILSLALIPILGIVAAFIVFAIAGRNTDTPNPAASGIGFAFFLAAYVILIVVYPAIYLTLLKSVKGQEISLSEAFHEGLTYFWRFFGLIILTGLIVGVGLLLLIVPGIIWLRMYWLAPYYLIDRNLGIGEAMRQSKADSKLYKGPIYGVLGVFVLFGLLGAVPFVGSIVGTILQFLYYAAPALRYQEISEATGYKPGVIDSTPVA